MTKKRPPRKSTGPVDECKPDAAGKPDEKPAADKPDKSGDKPADAKKDEKKDEKKTESASKDAEKTPEVKIDFENINQRILALPIPARNYDSLAAGKTHILYLMESALVNDGSTNGRFIHKFDVCSRKTEKLLDNIGGFIISSNGEKALYEQFPPPNPLGVGGGGPPHGHWSIKPVDGLGKPPIPVVRMARFTRKLSRFMSIRALSGNRCSTRWAGLNATFSTIPTCTART